ncbi:hypothetical protein LXL04_027585 [Taraxacum kok-saghyz]
MEKLTFKETAAAIAISKQNSAKKQQICLNLLNLAVAGSGDNFIPDIDRQVLPSVKVKKLVVNLVSLVANGGEVLLGKNLLFVTLLRVKKEVYVEKCFKVFFGGVEEVFPRLLESVISDVKKLVGEGGGTSTSKTNLRHFQVVFNLLGSSSLKYKVKKREMIQQLKHLIKLVESSFEGRG